MPLSCCNLFFPCINVVKFDKLSVNSFCFFCELKCVQRIVCVVLEDTKDTLDASSKQAEWRAQMKAAFKGSFKLGCPLSLTWQQRYEALLDSAFQLRTTHCVVVWQEKQLRTFRAHQKCLEKLFTWLREGVDKRMAAKCCWLLCFICEEVKAASCSNVRPTVP